MAARFPPLKALRAFEAVGRRGSFAAAAAELGVTPGAISRQVKTLEAHLQIPLLDRNHQEVALNDESQAYLRLLSEIFRDLEASTDALVQSPRVYPLHVVCTLTLATHWLVPRLTDFLARFPDQRVRLTPTVLHNVFGSQGNVDVSIQRGVAACNSFVSRRLWRVQLIPVCSPRLIGSGTALSVAELAADFTLLHANSSHSAWEMWFKGVGARKPPSDKFQEFGNNVLAYQAAMQGMGIALADASLIGDKLVSGELMCPLYKPVASGVDWHLVYPVSCAKDLRLQRFCRWALQMAPGRGPRSAASRHVERCAPTHRGRRPAQR